MKSNLQTLLLALLALVIVGVAYADRPWTPVRIAGAAIAIPALLLFVIARIQLGKAFTVRAQATELVTSGLYSRIRNPIYIFGGLTLVGAFFYINKPWLLFTLVILIPLQIHRIRKEERVLTKKFGDEYLHYKARTWL